jgi:MFS transporter, DHA2 family, multidrug resistance protein
MQKLPGIRHFIEFVRKQNSTFDTSSPTYRWWLLGNVMIGTFMAVLDATIVNVGLPKIMASFGVGLDKIEWVLTAYMLSLAVMLPTSGWLADRFGYKRVYFLGLFLFTLGSFLCGISPNEDILIFSRVIQGLGAGCIMPVGMAIVTREFPPEKRGIALGFWSIASAASVSFGPLIGGYLVDNFSWQLIFDVNIPVGIAGMLATAIIQKEFRNKVHRSFDVIGFISVSIFLPVLLYALTEGNAATNAGGWHSPTIIICLGIAALAFTVFLVTEFTIKEPLIDLRMLGNYNFGISALVIFIFGVGMFGSTFLIPLYLQNSMGYTAIQAGAVFLPLGIIQGIVAPFAGIFSDKINPKVPIILGATLLALSFYMNSSMSYLTELNYIMITLYMRGLAMGMMFGPLTTISLLSIPRHKMAQASGISNVIRQVGGSFGVALLSSIFATRMAFHSQLFGESLQSYSPVYHSVVNHLGNYVTTVTGNIGPNALKQSQYILQSNITKQAFIESIDDDFMLAAIITMLSAVPVFFLKGSKKKLNQQNIQPKVVQQGPESKAN